MSEKQPRHAIVRGKVDPRDHGATLRRHDYGQGDGEAHLRGIVRQQAERIRELEEQVRKLEGDIAVATGKVRGFRAAS